MKSFTADKILELMDAEAPQQKSDTQSAQAYREIRQAILDCRLAPGATIDERRLAAEFGFGRTPIREALLRLRNVRLVHFLAGQAIQVAPISLKDIRDLYEDRLHAERLAAFLAVDRLTAESLAEMQHNFDGAVALAKAGKSSDVIALDFRFHSLIYRGSQNGFLSEHLHNLFAHSYRLWRLTSTGEPVQLETIVKSHEPLIQAIAAKDAEKLDGLITQHVSQSFERLLERIKGSSFETIRQLQIIKL